MKPRKPYNKICTELLREAQTDVRINFGKFRPHSVLQYITNIQDWHPPFLLCMKLKMRPKR